MSEVNIVIVDVFNKPPALLWPQMASLLLLGVVVMTLSAMRFRKRLA